MKTAFLYGFIDKLIYIEVLKRSEIEINKYMIYKLLKALYELKQSFWLWYERLLGFLLEKLVLICIHADYIILITKTDLNRPIVSNFVDDIKIIAWKKSKIIQKIKQQLTTASLMINISLISSYLELKTEQNWENQIIKFLQSSYIDKVLNKFYFNKANTINMPMKKTIFF